MNRPLRLVLDRSQEEIDRVRRALESPRWQTSNARRARLELQQKILESTIEAIEVGSLRR